MGQKFPDKLKPYVTSLRKVHATEGTFTSTKAHEVGEQIYTSYGHEAMTWVYEIIRDQLGGAEMRDLEYEWNDIGEWRENGGESGGVGNRFKLFLLLNR